MLLVAGTTALLVIVGSLAVTTIVAAIIANLYTGVPYVSSPPAIIATAVTLLNLKSGQTVYDLGCGDGRFLFAAAAT